MDIANHNIKGKCLIVVKRNKDGKVIYRDHIPFESTLYMRLLKAKRDMLKSR